MKKRFHLVGSRTCPFVQRTLIALMLKSVNFELTYIDLNSKPEWFVELSPLGKVPLLKVHDSIRGYETVLFESTVINDYLDETIPPRLHPEEPIRRALNRAWIEFCTVMIGDLHSMVITTDQAKLNDYRQKLDQKLQRLEQQTSGEIYFNGPEFSLVDAAFAPFFRNLLIIDHRYPLHLLEGKPKLTEWSNNLLLYDAVKESVDENYEGLYLTNFRKLNGIICRTL